MKLKIADFKEDVPKVVRSTYDPKELDLEFVDLKYTKSLDLDGTVLKGHDALTFQGRLTSEIERTCARCLKPVKAQMDREFEFYYETRNRELIEATDDIRELLVLEHPIRFLCQEDCRGLCPECGTNLNESDCACSKAEKDKPLSAFKKVSVNKTESRKEKDAQS